jgi:hypothetical protein
VISCGLSSNVLKEALCTAITLIASSLLNLFSFNIQIILLPPFSVLVQILNLKQPLLAVSNNAPVLTFIAWPFQWISYLDLLVGV